MKTVHNLSSLNWKLAGFVPWQWKFQQSMELGEAPQAEIPPIAAPVPGSVQQALRNAGLLPDWNVGLNARSCEWVENRHWVYQVALPDEWLASGKPFRLRCLGLDYAGVVRLNGQEIGSFEGTFTPHVFDLTAHLRPAGNTLQIIFTDVPRWLGQFGYTSLMQQWKPRFNYTWDWTSRLVQVGIWDAISIEAVEGGELCEIRCTTDADPAAGTGKLRLSGRAEAPAGAMVTIRLTDPAGSEVRRQSVTADQLAQGVAWDDLPVALWWPNGHGGQSLYRLSVRLTSPSGGLEDEQTLTVGFKHAAWLPCRHAPAGADNWTCQVNGRPIFLQGVNWTPIRPNFADVTEDDYRLRIEQYRRIGCNVLRVWGGAFLEKECFYRLADEAGLLVWQEFPLSSSGIDNWPPEDAPSIEAMARIAESYILRRQHHVSLLCWCGGNELQGALDGGKVGVGKPVTMTHPLIARLGRVVDELDPTRRFLPTSSSGPRFYAEQADYGKGLHWDVHGPWKAEGDLEQQWRAYWEQDDSLFRSESGSPGASPAAIIRRYRGEFPETPGTAENPIWRRTSWWIEWPVFVKQVGREPEGLDEYVAWSQARQAVALAIAAAASKARFPGIGGFIIWMGHDSFPCTANTSILDFDGQPKPAAEAVGKVFREK